MAILEEYKERVQKLADALLAREVLDGDQVKRIVAGLSIDDDSTGGPPEPPRAVSDDRTRKESRPGFVPNLHNPLPQP